ncbi:hypothetical protein L7F22_049781 [Adiantum nelumboides]|nr:hypothetical protein [Adiantum nelumboides]
MYVVLILALGGCFGKSIFSKESFHDEEEAADVEAIDPHTHLDFEFMGSETIDDFFSGQAAALAGGTTMHIDFVIPVNGSLLSGLEAYEKSINSFKFFMAYKGALMINDELLLQGFKKCKSLGALAMVHAENGDAAYEGQRRMIELGITGPEGHALSRPPVLEGEATARAIKLAGFMNTPLYVVHVMSIDAMEEISKARKSGQKVIGEPVVSGLVLNDSWLWDPDFITAAKYVMSPPIRAQDMAKPFKLLFQWEFCRCLSYSTLYKNYLIWSTLLLGTAMIYFKALKGWGELEPIIVLSTQRRKLLELMISGKFPNGVNGSIEERMHLVWDTMVESGQISVTDYVRVTSTECARIFNIYPRKGAIRAGSDADIIILNPNSSFEISAKSHHSRSDTNVFEGWRGKGKVEVTISGGRVVWLNDELKVFPGSGKYVEMRPFSYLFNGIGKADAKYLSSLKAL